MGKQKATFDQLFPTYTYTVYYYKLLQRSKTYLSSWHWILVSVSLIHQEGNCKCWAQKYFRFTLEKTADCAALHPATRQICAVCSTWPPAINTHPSTDSKSFYCTPKEFQSLLVQLIKRKCVSITGRLFYKRSWYLWFHFLVVWTARTAWYLSKEINYHDRKGLLIHSLCFIVCKVCYCPLSFLHFSFSWKISAWSFPK